MKKQQNKKNKVNSGDWHGSRDSLGMGDFYGTGIRNAVGKVVYDSINNYKNDGRKNKMPHSVA